MIMSLTCLLVVISSLTISAKSVSSKVNPSLRQAPAHEVTGSVTDSTSGQPLSGVTIRVSGTTTGTATDANGQFRLSVPDNAVLVVSYLGYTTKRVSVNGKTKLHITLLNATKGLSQVVVIGYGTARKEDLTGSVAQVSSKELTEGVPTNIGQALQGKVAGAQVIQQGGGVPGGQPIIHIRGINSINTSSAPLYVVDGLVGVQNPFRTLNPYDIQSLSVLKGPSATAIYGARGANGVIVITTKKGSAGKTTVTYDGSVSVGVLQRHVYAANADQLLYIYMQAITNTPKYGTLNTNKDYRGCCGTGLTFSEMPWLFKQVPKGSYIIPLEGKDGNYYAPRFSSNWEDEMFNPSVSTNQHVEVKGGNDKANFSLALGYQYDDGLMLKSYSRNFTGRATGEVQIFDWLNMKAQMNFSKTKNTHDDGILRSTTEVWSFLPIKYPNDPDIYGTYAGRWGTNADFPIGEQWYNPVYRRNENVGYDNMYNTRGVLNLTATITDHLDFKTVFAANFNVAKSNDYDGRIYGSTGSASIDGLNTFYWQSQNYFTYKNTFNKRHNLEAMLGFAWSQRAWQGFNLGNSIFFSDFYKWHNIGVGSAPKPTVGSFDGNNELNSYFLRVHYDYNHKYLLTLTGRFDGSSRFGPNEKYGFFPSVGAAWNVSQEDFMDNLDFISHLKLRGEAGITGNQEIGTIATITNQDIGGYVTQAYVSANSNIIFGDGTATGLYPSSLGNPNLHWETTKSYGVGIDLGLWNDRVNISTDYYYKKTTGTLLYLPTPVSTTTGSSIQNYGSVQNKGWEFAVNTRNIQNGDFSWSTTITAASNRNKILSLGPNGAPIYTNLSEGYPGSVLKVGEPIGSYFTLVRLGVWSTEQVAEAAYYDLKPGDLHYADLNHDGQISLPEDGKITGHAFPDWTADVTNQFTYKNLDLGFDIRFVTGVNRYFVHESAEDRQLVSGGLNTVLDAWRPDHQNTVIAQMRGGNQGAYYQALNDSHDVYDGSYIKGAHATLGYTFSDGFLQHVNIASLRVYLKAQRFFVLTDAYGYNVEGSSLDQVRSLVPGEDKYAYPRPATYTFGVNIQF
jgi:TonB-linked SusC/RagA family outer membrane protein